MKTISLKILLHVLKSKVSILENIFKKEQKVRNFFEVSHEMFEFCLPNERECQFVN